MHMATKSSIVFPSTEQQQHYWDERWDRNKMPNDWALLRSEKMLAYIRQVRLRQPNILDLGCGTGWFTQKLSSFGEATGIDLSETAIAIAKSQFPHIHYIKGNIFEMTLPREHFDLVVCQEVIAHVPDQLELLSRIANVLKPAGYLVITTVNKFIIDRVDFGPDPDEHIKQWLSMKDLRELLRQRFDVLRTTTVLPMGYGGVLRLVNASLLNSVLFRLLGPSRLAVLKERAGLGYTMIALAQKRN